MTNSPENHVVDPNLQAAIAVSEGDYGLEMAQVQSLGVGLINKTYLVQNATGSYVLQHMNEMFPPESTADFKAATDYLADRGWEVPQLVPTLAGEAYSAVNSQDWWRMMTFIESDVARPVQLSPEQYSSAGELLARLHNDLSTVDYEPVFTIPHFHDTPYYAGRMQEVWDDLPSVSLKARADAMLTALEKLPELPGSEPQLLHGDPQTPNMLFRDGKPFTLIDWDTVMRGPIWIDLGDMLRSLAEDSIEAGNGFPLEDIRAVARGYAEATKLPFGEEEFFRYAMLATQKIALELGMRFLTDVVDDNYFGYNPNLFSNRRESNIHRSGIQLEVYKYCQEVL